MVTYTEFTENDAVVVTLAQAKQNLNLLADETDDDALIQSFIEAAHSECIAYIGRPLAGELVLHCDNFADVELEAYPVASLLSVEFLPAGETEYVALDPGNVKFFRKYRGNFHGITFRNTDENPLPALAEDKAAVKVRIKSECPKALCQGMLLRITDFYEKREDRGEVGYNMASRNLWRPFARY